MNIFSINLMNKVILKDTFQNLIFLTYLKFLFQMKIKLINKDNQSFISTKILLA
jgi:hypothetical protein